MMKRILCLVLCLLLAVPAALAETADTLPKRFVRQLSGGNGARGYISISASGVADWLNMLLPFTASDIQVRAIGEKQGEMSQSISDDDDWQVKFYVKDAMGKEAGTTWLYGNPDGVYFQSDLLPDTLLTFPVKQVNLLYQLFHGEFSELLFAFDPMDMKAPGKNGNASAYKAIAEMLEIPEEEWTAEWLPVLDKYFTHLDLWLAGYGESSIISAEDAGSLKMSASYTIPVEELKTEAKYIIGQMMYDNDLQNLLIPLVTLEQRITYLNPQMVYFYEACIDALELNGDVILSREMSAMGEVVSTTVELPLPKLPEKVSGAVGSAVKNLLQLPYDNLLQGMERLVMTQSGKDRTIKLCGSTRTVTVTSAPADENAVTGKISIIPSDGAAESKIAAEYSMFYAHRIWQDEKYLDHDTIEFAFSVKPDSESTGEGTLEFQPVDVAWTLDYRNNPHQQDSPVQVNLDIDAKLPDAEMTVEAVLRITTQMTMEYLSTAGAEDLTELSEEQKEALLSTFVLHAVDVMASLDGNETMNAETGAIVQPAAEPTAVPPMNE